MGSHSHTTVRPAFCTARISFGRCFSILSAPNRPISVRRPARPSGLRISISRSSSSGSSDGPHFKPDRIDDAAAVLDVRAVRLARAVADPQHVAAGGDVVARAHRLVAPGQRLLVAQQQRLVAGVEAGGAQRQRVLGRHAEQAVDLHRALDLVGQLVVALLDRRALHELAIPSGARCRARRSRHRAARAGN